MIPNTDTDVPTEPVTPVLAGDHHDDDGQVFDSLVEPSAEPPALDELPLVKNDSKSRPRATTRLANGTVQLRADMGPVMLVPPDPDRINLHLALSNPDGHSFRFGTDAPSVASRMGAFTTTHDGLLSAFEDHTGALWVLNASPERDETSFPFVSYTAVIA